MNDSRLLRLNYRIRIGLCCLLTHIFFLTSSGQTLTEHTLRRGDLDRMYLSYTPAGLTTGKTYPLNLDKVNEIFPDYWICSNEKAKKLLGFQPQYDLATGMADAVKWYRQNHWL